MKLHWGTGIALVYTLFAAATLGFAVFAMAQDVDLVSADYYDRALKHDDRMAAQVNAAALGSAFRVEVDLEGRAITLAWTDARPRPGAGEVALYRPSDAGSDRVIPIHPDTAGRQRMSLADLPMGRWLVQVQWQADGREYYAERPIVLP